MKERPILFSAPMVRAILAGTKTQTRRAVKPHKAFVEWGVKGPGDAYDATVDDAGQGFFLVAGDHGYAGPVPCPYGQPGDRLWVRECWARDDEDASLMYRADVGLGGDADEWERGRLDGVPRYRWRPSIHMPRWASRITLEVTGVRVERLNDISGPDAAAEGIQFRALGAGVPLKGNIWKQNIEKFRALWESINGAGSWDANPWVWVVEFKMLRSNA